MIRRLYARECERVCAQERERMCARERVCVCERARAKDESVINFIYDMTISYVT